MSLTAAKNKQLLVTLLVILLAGQGICGTKYWVAYTAKYDTFWWWYRGNYIMVSSSTPKVYPKNPKDRCYYQMEDTAGAFRYNGIKTGPGC